MNIEKSYLALLSDLSSIQPSVLIRKDGDQLLTMQCSNEQTIFYTLRVPNDFFSFESKQVGFHTYSEFYSIFKAFEKAEVTQPNDTTLVVGEGRSKIKYGLTPENAIRGKFSKMDTPEFEVNVDMPQELLQLIRSRSSLISSKFINFRTDQGKLTLKTFDPNNPSNEWTHVIEDSEIDSDVDLDVNFPIEMFNTCPKGSYTMSISSQGLTRFVFNSETFDLVIFAVGAELHE